MQATEYETGNEISHRNSFKNVVAYHSIFFVNVSIPSPFPRIFAENLQCKIHTFFLIICLVALTTFFSHFSHFIQLDKQKSVAHFLIEIFSSVFISLLLLFFGIAQP